jgi:hypothetical protein
VLGGEPVDLGLGHRRVRAGSSAGEHANADAALYDPCSSGGRAGAPATTMPGSREPIHEAERFVAAGRLEATSDGGGRRSTAAALPRFSRARIGHPVAQCPRPLAQPPAPSDRERDAGARLRPFRSARSARRSRSRRPSSATGDAVAGRVRFRGPGSGAGRRLARAARERPLRGLLRGDGARQLGYGRGVDRPGRDVPRRAEAPGRGRAEGPLERVLEGEALLGISPLDADGARLDGGRRYGP